MRLFRKADHNRRQPLPDANRGPVFSYYASRSQTPEPTRRQGAVQQRSRNIQFHTWLRNIPTILALVVVVGSVLYSLTLTPQPKIITHALTPAAETFLRDKQDYELAASEALQRSIFNRSKLTINTQAIADELKNNFPELADVSVTLPLLGRRPVIQVDATEPKLILASNSKAYVVDYRGVVLMDVQDAADFSKDLPVVTDESGLSVTRGEPVLSSENITYITEVVRQLAAKHLSPSTITLPPLARELHVRVQGKPYYIKLNLTNDVRVGVGAFLAVKEKLEKDGITPADYIDVRIEERAYYK